MEKKGSRKSKKNRQQIIGKNEEILENHSQLKT